MILSFVVTIEGPRSEVETAYEDILEHLDDVANSQLDESVLQVQRGIDLLAPEEEEEA